MQSLCLSYTFIKWNGAASSAAAADDTSSTGFWIPFVNENMSECFEMHEVLYNCQILLLDFSVLLLYSATLLNSFVIYESLYIDSFSFLQ